MKPNLLATVAVVGGLALAGSASAQLVGGAVGGAVGGTVSGGAIGKPIGGGVSGSVNAGARTQLPSATVPSAPLPSTPSVTTPLPGATPSLTTPSASVSGSASADANASAASSTSPVNLSGLAPGMAVRDTKGRALGKVSRVVKRADGTISAVEVAAANQAGKTMSLEPSTLSVGSGVVTYANTSASASPK